MCRREARPTGSGAVRFWQEIYDEQGVLVEVVGRLGLADVRAFGLTRVDCETLLQRLGFKAHVDITAA